MIMLPDSRLRFVCVYFIFCKINVSSRIYVYFSPNVADTLNKVHLIRQYGIRPIPFLKFIKFVKIKWIYFQVHKSVLTVFPMYLVIHCMYVIENVYTVEIHCNQVLCGTSKFA